jgi:hypothetical protein
MLNWLHSPLEPPGNASDGGRVFLMPRHSCDANDIRSLGEALIKVKIFVTNEFLCRIWP